jgi:hypothetical protein
MEEIAALIRRATNVTEQAAQDYERTRKDSVKEK